METMISLFIVLFGLAWGSFLNVVIFRLPRNMSLATPPSTCPGCGRRIRPYDNIPVLSYVLLRGKCRACGFRIPFSYVLVEAVTPLCFLLIYGYSGRVLGAPFFAGALFASAMIVVAVIDFHLKVIPDAITLPGLGLALVYGALRADMTFREAMIGAVVGSGFLLFIYGAYYLARKKEGLGMGDVMLMLVIGAYLGWTRTVFTLILGSLAGAAIGTALMIGKKKGLQAELPFGTFLAPAALVALLWGGPIISAYLGLFKR
jgi:leader peptidase (prepilin peptidase) / N-methyltransferase